MKRANLVAISLLGIGIALLVFLFGRAAWDLSGGAVGIAIKWAGID